VQVGTGASGSWVWQPTQQADMLVTAIFEPAVPVEPIEVITDFGPSWYFLGWCGWRGEGPFHQE